ncbi:hypothetical protein D9M71_789970 [compost metagenome]
MGVLLTAFAANHTPNATMAAPPKKIHTSVGTEASRPIKTAPSTNTPDVPDLPLLLRFLAMPTAPS